MRKLFKQITGNKPVLYYLIGLFSGIVGYFLYYDDSIGDILPSGAAGLILSLIVGAIIGIVNSAQKKGKQVNGLDVNISPFIYVILGGFTSSLLMVILDFIK